MCGCVEVCTWEGGEWVVLWVSGMPAPLHTIAAFCPRGMHSLAPADRLHLYSFLDREVHRVLFTTKDVAIGNTGGGAYH